MDIYLVTTTSNNNVFAFQFAFTNYEEADKLRHKLDQEKGGTSKQSTIHVLRVYETISQLIGEKE